MKGVITAVGRIHQTQSGPQSTLTTSTAVMTAIVPPIIMVKCREIRTLPTADALLKTERFCPPRPTARPPLDRADVNGLEVRILVLGDDHRHVDRPRLVEVALPRPAQAHIVAGDERVVSIDGLDRTLEELDVVQGRRSRCLERLQDHLEGVYLRLI